MESKKADDIKNLLLKIIIPLAFPVVGSFIFDLITNRPNRDRDVDSSDSSIQLDPPNCLDSVHREEEEQMDSLNCRLQKLVHAEIPCSTVAVNKVQDLKIAEEMESLKNMVSAFEERASSIESQFHDYCDMKEQESTYQKMQIMCLGIKLEQLESQNQRLEAAAMEIRNAAEEFAAMRAKLDALQNKFKKTAKKSRQEFGAIDERILALDAKESEMASKCECFEQCIEEMKQLTLQLQKDKGTNDENVEVMVERSMRKLSSSRDLVDGLEALRDRWTADMEEMIYLGWITAWLQHDLLVCDDDGTVAAGNNGHDEGGNALHPPAQRKGEKMVAVVASSNEVELCKASSSAASEMQDCIGFPGCRSGRPRLLHKLRGWARGKGGSSISSKKP